MKNYLTGLVVVLSLLILGIGNTVSAARILSRNGVKAPVVSGFPGTATVIGTPTLTLKYDTNRNEVALEATAKVQVKAVSSDICIPKVWGAWISVVDSNGPSAIGSGDNTLSQALPSKTILEGLDCWVLSKGKTVEINSSRNIDPKQNFAGVYRSMVYAVYNLYLDKNRDLALQEILIPEIWSSPVTIIGEKSPYINSVTESVRAGDMFTVDGVRLTADSLIYIDGVYVPNLSMTGANEKTIKFTVPSSFSAGGHQIEVGNRYGKSNSLYFTVTTTKVAPTATVIGAPTLSLQYDANRNESALVAKGKISVTAGSEIVRTVNNASLFSIASVTGGNDYYLTQKHTLTPTSPEVITQSVTESGEGYADKISDTKYYVIPIGKTAFFDVSSTFYPKEMFAGTYDVKFVPETPSYYTDEDTVRFTNSYKSNSVTVVGEKSPYINSVTQSVKVGENLTILGERLNPMTSSYFDGKNFVIDSKTLMNSVDGKKLYFTVPSSWPVGRRSLELENNYGKSNKVWFDVTSSATITQISAPTLVLQYDSNKNESALVAGGFVTVKAGSVDVDLANSLFIGFETKEGYSTGGDGPLLFEQYVGQVGRGTYKAVKVVPAGQTMTIRVTSKINPALFPAGEIKASVWNALGQAKLSPASNPVVVVGEKSPYIKSVVLPTAKGGQITFTGDKLSSINDLGIDGVKTPMARLLVATSTVKFNLPTNITAGWHDFQFGSPLGKSNFFRVEIPSSLAKSNSFVANVYSAVVGSISKIFGY